LVNLYQTARRYNPEDCHLPIKGACLSVPWQPDIIIQSNWHTFVKLRMNIFPSEVTDIKSSQSSIPAWQPCELLRGGTNVGPFSTESLSFLWWLAMKVDYVLSIQDYS
jgi:hypothetical protein